MAEDEGFYGIIEGPGDYAPPEAWEKHLAEVRAMKFQRPADKRRQIEKAKWNIAQSRRRPYRPARRKRDEEASTQSPFEADVRNRFIANLLDMTTLVPPAQVSALRAAISDLLRAGGSQQTSAEGRATEILVPMAEAKRSARAVPRQDFLHQRVAVDRDRRSNGAVPCSRHHARGARSGAATVLARHKRSDRRRFVRASQND